MDGREQKVGSAEQQLRLWGIKSDSVANGMGQVGACLPYDAVVCLRQACFFSAEPTFFSRSDFFSATVRDVRGEHREPPWA